MFVHCGVLTSKLYVFVWKNNKQKRIIKQNGHKEAAYNSKR